MSDVLQNLVIFCLSYTLGSLSSAILIAKAAGLPDPRGSGSNNPGATNMLRIAGKKLGALTLLLDTLKGALAVWAVSLYTLDPLALSLALIGAFLGHLYPIFFGFKGGKGVATYLGGILVLAWPLGLVFIGSWLLIALLFRRSSLAALLAILAVLGANFVWGLPWAGALLLTSSLLFWRHRANIQRLYHGQEPKIFAK